MDHQPLVSVIMAFKNGGRFIQESIDSVLAQSYSNWELLLMDDGSTDGSTRIARECAARNPERVIYLEHRNHENRGVCVSRNVAVQRARGEYIGLLDVDDLWLPRKLEQQVAILSSNRTAAMVYGRSMYWHSWSGDPEDLTRDHTPDLGIEEDTLFEPPLLSTLLHPLGPATAPPPSDLLVRRETVERVGGFEEDFRGPYQLYEDQAFLIKVYLTSPVFVSGETWDKYRVHANSCVSVVNRAGQQDAARAFFLKWLESYLNASSIHTPRVWAALHKSLRAYGGAIPDDRITQLDSREMRWWLRLGRGSVASLVFPPADPDVVRVAITRARKKAAYDIQANQAQLKVAGATRYVIEFRARADRSRVMSIGLAQAHEPWSGLGLYTQVNLTTEWRDFRYELVASADDDNARIHFDVGDDDASVELGSVRLRTWPEGRLVEPAVNPIAHYPAERWTESAEPGGRSTSATAIRDLESDADRARVTESDSDTTPLAFSIVIPTYQRRELVVAAVLSLARQDVEERFEVIVVVDGSTDGSAAQLKTLQPPFRLTVIEQPNQGAASARNRGAGVARGDFLLFLDDDMEAHTRLLAEHTVSHAQGADVVFGQLPLHVKSPKNFLSVGIGLWADERTRRLSVPGAAMTHDDLLTGQMSISRKTFNELGGFDTNFTKGGTFGNEDIDFGHRLLRNGYKTVFNPFAISYQNYTVQPRHYLRQARQQGRADVVLARKHPDQAPGIFAARGAADWMNRRVWRPLTSLLPLTLPLVAGLRVLAVTLAERGVEPAWSVRLFYQVRELEYWRGVREAGGIPRPRPLRVLAYHAIRSLERAPVIESYGTPFSSFQRQLSALRRAGFHFVTGDEFVRFLHHGGGLPPRPLLLTFDDGYRELADLVAPFLREEGIPAVVFAVTGRLGGTNVWDQALGAPQLELLDAAGLRLLADGGMEIGTHSRSHRPLAGMPGDELVKEVTGSVDDLAAVGLGRARLMSYPYGVSDGRVVQTVRDAGLEAAFTVTAGRVRPGHDPYQIPRIEVMSQDTGWKFLWKVITAH